MSQNNLWSPTTGTVSGGTLTSNYNGALDSLLTLNSGASAPTNQSGGVPEAGQYWLDTSATPYKLKWYDGASWIIVGYIDATAHLAQLGPIPAWHITGGYPTAMSGTSTTASITISAGSGADASGLFTLSWGTLTFAASNGNAANGCADGSTLLNSKTYHVYVCVGSSGTCCYASQTLSMAASSAPLGFRSYVRRGFSFLTDSAGTPRVMTVTERDGGTIECIYASTVNDLNSITVASTRTLYALTVPTGFRVRPLIRFQNNATASGNVVFGNPDEQDNSPAGTTGADMQQVSGTSFLSGRNEMLTNTAAQIYGRASTGGSAGTYGATFGFIDSRRV